MSEKQTKVITTMTFDPAMLDRLDAVRAQIRPIPSRSKLVRDIVQLYLDQQG
jgi:metal-responsive CopG/Arc/MetJ family transcriptional regulator